MIVKKTIKCKIFHPTKKKFDLLNREYKNLQVFLKKGKDQGVYSSYKQQALRFYKKIKLDKDYPLSIRKDLIRIEKHTTKLTEYWARIPVSAQYGGVWLPIKPHCLTLNSYEICESKILKKDDEFFIHITIQKQVPIKRSYSSFLSMDLGEKVIATTVLSSEQKPTFYGREVRGIRRHYNWLRKRLGKKKLLKKIKQIGQKEKRTVNDILHKISRKIVNTAKQNHSIIILGDLKNIRNSNKGKKFNRIVSNMPYYKLTQMITYKANWEGVLVLKVNERGTSITCSRCGSEGRRPRQGLFVCKKCSYEVNADFNASKNILKRSLEYIFNDGALVNKPLTCPENIRITFSNAVNETGDQIASIDAPDFSLG